MTSEIEHGHGICERGPVIGWYRGREIFAFLRYTDKEKLWILTRTISGVVI